MDAKALSKSFIVNVKDKDGNIAKLDFTKKMATKATMKLMINNIELENKENQQILLKEYNGYVDRFIKPSFNNLLEDNDLTALSGYNATDIGQLQVHSRTGIQTALIPNFDINLSNGRIKDVLANETAGKMAQVKLENQKIQYNRFDESADSYIPWKVDMTGKKTKITGSTTQSPTPAIDKYIENATTAAHNTLERATLAIQSGLRAIKFSKSELNTSGKLAKLLDQVIFKIQKYGVTSKNDTNDVKIKSEGAIAHIGGISRSDFKIYMDLELLDKLKDSGTLFIANTGNKLNIQTEVYKYRGVEIVPKLMGSRPIYIVLNNSWTLQSFVTLSTEISGGSGLGYETGLAGAKAWKALLPTERLLTISYLTRYIKPDVYTGPVWSIEFV